MLGSRDPPLALTVVISRTYSVARALDLHYPPTGRVGLSGAGRAFRQVIADSAVVAFPLPGRYRVRPSRREGGTARNKRSASPCSYFARFSAF